MSERELQQIKDIVSATNREDTLETFAIVVNRLLDHNINVYYTVEDKDTITYEESISEIADHNEYGGAD